MYQGPLKIDFLSYKVCSVVTDRVPFQTLQFFPSTYLQGAVKYDAYQYYPLLVLLKHQRFELNQTKWNSLKQLLVQNIIFLTNMIKQLHCIYHKYKPAYPGKHVQLYPPSVLDSHFPLLAHGEASHMSITISHLLPDGRTCKWLYQ